MVRTTRGVGVHPLAQESQVLHCKQAHDPEEIYINHITHTSRYMQGATIALLSNADASDGSACKVFSWSVKLKLVKHHRQQAF